MENEILVIVEADSPQCINHNKIISYPRLPCFIKQRWSVCRLHSAVGPVRFDRSVRGDSPHRGWVGHRQPVQDNEMLQLLLLPKEQG